MKTALLVLSFIAFLAGLIILGSAKSAIHEIEGFVLYVVSAVFLSGAAIVGAINKIAGKSEKPTPEK